MAKVHIWALGWNPTSGVSLTERWAKLCKYLGNLTPDLFKKAEKRLYPAPDRLKSRLKRLFCFDQADCEGLLRFVWGL